VAKDAMDPGPDGTYPNWPRRPATGEPDFTERMRTGLHREPKPAGDVDLTPRYPVDHPLAGQPIVPPTIPPGGTP